MHLLGDVNLDGEITAQDVTMLARHIAKIEILIEPAALINADVTGDEAIDKMDLTKLSRFVAKITDSLEQEQ